MRRIFCCVWTPLDPDPDAKYSLREVDKPIISAALIYARVAAGNQPFWAEDGVTQAISPYKYIMKDNIATAIMFS